MEKRIPRGIRNNNPLNIRISNTEWIGKIKNNTDGEFEQFDTMLHGIRAGFVLLRTYIRKYHLTTVEAIINRFAPHQDNNPTQRYIAFVCNIAFINPNTEIVFENALLMCRIVNAMIIFECGRIVEWSTIKQAYAQV